MAEGELESLSTLCPRCGDAALIRASAVGTADVSCPKCGRFEAPWEEFNNADDSGAADAGDGK